MHFLAKKNTFDFSSAGLVRSPRVLGLKDQKAASIVFTLIVYIYIYIRIYIYTYICIYIYFSIHSM